MHDVKVSQKVYIVAQSSKRPGRNRNGLASQTKPYRVVAWRIQAYFIRVKFYPYKIGLDAPG